MKVDEVVQRVLTSIGRPAEVEYYLSLFRAAEPASFAVIAVSDTVMRDAAGALATDLRLLARLGLTPVVLFGLTGPRAAATHASELSRRLTQVDHRRVPPADAGATAAAGAIPLVALTDDGRDTDDRFRELADLARALPARKLIFLGRRSGLQPRDRQPPSLVDITTEYDQLAAPGVLPNKQRALLAQIRRLLAEVGHPMTVAVTSPLDLLRELFTERGAGTLLRRGSEIRRAASYSEVDRERLVALIGEAFRRPLRPALFDRPVAALYIANDYRGAAVIEPTDLGGYLSKFAVGTQARGEGVGRDLWRALAADFPRLYWRARAGNPVTSWYANQADGMQRGPDWTIFWRGLEPDEIPIAIERGRVAPVDFDDS